MDRSPGFGSNPHNYIALFRLAFAAAPLTLNLAVQINSLTHYAKGTWSLSKRQLPQLVSTRFQILFHSS